MSYDIYGQHLRPGYCEVHPHVAEEYPCSICWTEREREQARQQESAERRYEAERAREAEEFANAEYESWSLSRNSQP